MKYLKEWGELGISDDAGKAAFLLALLRASKENAAVHFILDSEDSSTH